MTSPAEPAPDTGQLVSAVCHLDADRGRLTYRGYDVNELADHATFEEVSFLLVAGALPSKAELTALRRGWVAAQRLTPAERRWLRSVPADADELVVLRTAVSGLSLAGPAAVTDAPALISPRGAAPSGKGAGAGGGAAASAPEWRCVTTMGPAGAGTRLPAGGHRCRAAEGGGAGLRRGAHTARRQRAQPRYVRRPCRGVHGCRPDELRHRGDGCAGRTEAQRPHPGRGAASRRGWSIRPGAGVAEKLAQAGKKPAGFGHPVYRGEDPRTPTARRLAEAACAGAGRHGHLRTGRAVEEAVVRRTGLRANVDYYLTVVYLAAGLPVAAFAPVFAVARTSGWIAHVLEQSRDPELIRPRAVRRARGAAFPGPSAAHRPTVAHRPLTAVREDHGLRIPRRFRRSVAVQDPLLAVLVPRGDLPASLAALDRRLPARWRGRTRAATSRARRTTGSWRMPTRRSRACC